MNIRKGTLKDIPAVRDLVYKLAVYENEPDALTATVEHYEEQYQAGLFEIIVAESENEIMGWLYTILDFRLGKVR